MRELQMAKDKYYGKTLRKNFARHEEVMPMPNTTVLANKNIFFSFISLFSYINIILPSVHPYRKWLE